MIRGSLKHKTQPVKLQTVKFQLSSFSRENRVYWFTDLGIATVIKSVQLIVFVINILLITLLI